MHTLYILCGPSGCGKSTWAKHQQTQRRMAYVSRDEIRFAMLQDNEDYFAHEKEVFQRFVQAIAHFLPYDDVLADATHLHQFSRRKLTHALDQYQIDYDIIYVVFQTDLNTCLWRNYLREGRARLPEDAIRKMFIKFKAPTIDEDSRAKEVIFV